MRDRTGGRREKREERRNKGGKRERKERGRKRRERGGKKKDREEGKRIINSLRCEIMVIELYKKTVIPEYVHMNVCMYVCIMTNIEIKENIVLREKKIYCL